MDGFAKSNTRHDVSSPRHDQTVRDTNLATALRSEERLKPTCDLPEANSDITQMLIGGYNASAAAVCSENALRTMGSMTEALPTAAECSGSNSSACRYPSSSTAFQCMAWPLQAHQDRPALVPTAQCSFFSGCSQESQVHKCGRGLGIALVAG